MATSDQLKQNIDTQITTKTAEKSIAPADVGNNMKAIVDYVDQEIEAANTPAPAEVKVAKVDITEAEILMINAFPVTILQNTTPGKTRIPTSVLIRQLTGTGYDMSGSPSRLAVICDNTDVLDTLEINTNLISSAPFFLVAGPIPLNGGATVDTTLVSDFKLAGSGAALTGDGDWEVYVTYLELTIPVT